MGVAAWTVLGVLLVLVTIRDVVHGLFDPAETGSVSRWVMHGVWRAVRAAGRWRRRFIFRAGPLVLVCVAATWTATLVLGFALVYWPRLETGFHVNSEIPPERARGFPVAVYLSLASMTTLGSSDVTPVFDGLRYAAALESLMGMVLITAWITWVLSIYPVLADRRAFAREVLLIERAYPSAETAVAESPGDATAELLRSLTEQVLAIGGELMQTRVSYYFQHPSPELALATRLPYVLELGRAAERVEWEPLIRHRGMLLRTAVEAVLCDIGNGFLGLRDAPPEQVISALARDHLLPDPMAERGKRPLDVPPAAPPAAAGV